MRIKFLILFVILFTSCENSQRKMGNIQIYEQAETKRFDIIYLYFADFQKFNLEVNIYYRSKLTKKDSSLSSRVIGNYKHDKNIVVYKVDRYKAIRNEIIIEIEGITNIILTDINSSEYCVIYAKENYGKIDLSFSFRSSPPDFYVGKENPYYKNRDK